MGAEQDLKDLLLTGLGQPLEWDGFVRWVPFAYEVAEDGPFDPLPPTWPEPMPG